MSREIWPSQASSLEVRDNGGCRGADGMTVDHFDEYLEEEIDRLGRGILELP